MSRRVHALAITILTLAYVPGAQQLPVPERPALFGPHTEPRKPTRHMPVIACGGPPPSTIAEWWTAAAGIVRVRINSHVQTFDRNPDPELPPYIYTELDVAVLDVYKLHPHGTAVGGTMTITHPGGKLELVDAYYVSVTNNFPPPAPGTEWILFLYWNEDLNEFSIFSLQYGAFLIAETKIAPIAPSRFGDAWGGREVDDLAAAIRGGR